MTTPDDTRATAVLLDHAPELWRDERDRWVRWECRCGESCVYPDGYTDQAPLQLDAAKHVLAALRDSGWQDPEEVALERADYLRALEERDEARAERDRVVADRNHHRAVAETNMRWQEHHRKAFEELTALRAIHKATIEELVEVRHQRDRVEKTASERGQALDALEAERAALRDSGWVDPEEAARLRGHGDRVTKLCDSTKDTVVENARRELDEFWPLLEAAKGPDDLSPVGQALSRSSVLASYLGSVLALLDAHSRDTASLLIEAQQLRAQIAPERELVEANQHALSQALAERDALLPVVEAAKAWRANYKSPYGAAYEDDMVLVSAVDALESQEPAGHAYLSTGCLHGEHDYCRCDVGRSGPKTPGQCKFCAAPCRCGCHAETREESTDGR